MSAALPLPIHPGGPRLVAGNPITVNASLAQAGRQIRQRRWGEYEAERWKRRQKPAANLAFYRRHTEKMLRRYLYASSQVGRAPSVLADPVGRGWASSRPVRTFEDAMIFVLDVEACLKRLNALDQQLLSRVVLQEYTQLEVAAMLGMAPRTVCTRLALALDSLTELLLEAGLLLLPHQ
ncbi:MAG TPA: sigma factor-like helix-turn-helix DNA-binding protein [Terracidiphilus sp.]|nr:sigma factor-like helix-turn-helix DNA-binding protein [Terracidiphilus sp.]